jgi:hypothetical protein
LKVSYLAVTSDHALYAYDLVGRMSTRTVRIRRIEWWGTPLKGGLSRPGARRRRQRLVAHRFQLEKMQPEWGFRTTL